MILVAESAQPPAKLAQHDRNAMIPERDIVIRDEDCPLEVVYRVSAEYARRQSKWAPLVPASAVTVTLMHPKTDTTDHVVFDSSWS